MQPRRRTRRKKNQKKKQARDERQTQRPAGKQSASNANCGARAECYSNMRSGRMANSQTAVPVLRCELDEARRRWN